MKRFFLFFITVFICLNTYGQDTYTGKIIRMQDPACTSPIVPCLPCGGKVLGIETASGNYVLNPGAGCLPSYLILEDVVYLVGDEVEITGTVSTKQIHLSEEYLELEIETVKMISGQNTFVGEIIRMTDPSCSPPSPPCSNVFGFKTVLDNYFLSSVLSSDSHLFTDKLIIEDIEYFVDDKVEITVTINAKQDSYSRKYIEFEIETIKKPLSSLVGSLLSDKTKIYLDATTQAIIIAETLQNQPSTFELVDLQGSTILKKITTGESISIANIPNGIYLCRILQDGRVVYSDKIVKR